ncbi:LacI family transcriptional regulator [bacterium]|nr:LacI family transcriptional regulator [bacterium]
MVKNTNRTGTNPVTLADIAARAGVSTATVSLALHNSDNVAEKTCQKVLQAAKELEYVYNAGAASLRTNRTYTVGVIMHATSGSYFGELTQGIEGALDRAGYSILLSLTLDDLEKQERVLMTMRQRQMDGMIFLPAPNTPAAMLDNVRDSYNIPTVLLARSPYPDMDFVGPDNPHGGQIATEHLIQCGYQRIGYIGERGDRYDAYRNTMQRHNLPVDESIVIHCPGHMFYSTTADASLSKAANCPMRCSASMT